MAMSNNQRVYAIFHSGVFDHVGSYSSDRCSRPDDYAGPAGGGTYHMARLLWMFRYVSLVNP